MDMVGSPDCVVLVDGLQPWQNPVRNQISQANPLAILGVERATLDLLTILDFLFPPGRRRQRLVPEDRTASAALHKAIITDPIRLESYGVTLELRQGVTAGAGRPYRLALSEQPLPWAKAAAATPMILSGKNVAQVAPGHIKWRLKASLLARSHHTVGWSFAFNFEWT